MSNISTLYDGLISRLEAIYPSHVRLSNPYAVEDNDDQDLLLGFGVQVIDAIDSKRNLSCKMSMAQNFIVVLTRVADHLENDRPSWADEEKELLEDRFLFINDTHDNTDMGIVGDAGLLQYTFISSPGIDFVFGVDEATNFMKMELLVLVEYNEDL